MTRAEGFRYVAACELASAEGPSFDAALYELAAQVDAHFPGEHQIQTDEWGSDC